MSLWLRYVPEPLLRLRSKLFCRGRACCMEHPSGDLELHVCRCGAWLIRYRDANYAYGYRGVTRDVLEQTAGRLERDGRPDLRDDLLRLARRLSAA